MRESQELLPPEGHENVQVVEHEAQLGWSIDLEEALMGLHRKTVVEHLTEVLDDEQLVAHIRGVASLLVAADMPKSGEVTVAAILNAVSDEPMTDQELADSLEVDSSKLPTLFNTGIRHVRRSITELKELRLNEIEKNFRSHDRKIRMHQRKIRKEKGDGSDLRSIAMYLEGIGKYPLLDKSQEQFLSKTYVQGMNARKLLDTGLSIDPDFDEAQSRLADSAKERLILANLRLVVSIAKRYRDLGLPLEDLIDEGNKGLIRAVEKFDPEKNYKFSTYGTWWIKQAVTRGLQDSGRTVRIPVHFGETLIRIRKAERELAKRGVSIPKVEDLSIETGIDIDVINAALEIERTSETVSMDQDRSTDGDGGMSFVDILADSRSDDEYDAVTAVMATDKMIEIINASTLISSNKEIAIAFIEAEVRGEPRTLDDVGKEFGVTRERARQVRTNSYRILRKHSGMRELAGGLGFSEPAEG